MVNEGGSGGEYMQAQHWEAEVGASWARWQCGMYNEILPKTKQTGKLFCEISFLGGDVNKYIHPPYKALTTNQNTIPPMSMLRNKWIWVYWV